MHDTARRMNNEDFAWVADGVTISTASMALKSTSSRLVKTGTALAAASRTLLLSLLTTTPAKATSPAAASLLQIAR